MLKTLQGHIFRFSLMGVKLCNDVRKPGSEHWVCVMMKLAASNGIPVKASYLRSLFLFLSARD